MLHNIFEKLKKRSRNIKERTKPIIIADIHEKDSMILIELKSSRDIGLEIMPLKIGDYLVGDTIIERKTTSDFISSMLNKRLIEQLRQMRQYKEKLLIIEGDFFSILEKDNNLNPNAIRGFILSIIKNYETNIIFTKDYRDTTAYLITLAKQQIKPKTKTTLHSRIPKTIEEQKQYILEAFPNIGPRKAEELLKRFKTLNNVFNAKEEDLKEVLKNQSKNFRDILTS